MQPYSKEWEELANQLARDWVKIYPCKKCHYPVVDGYRCDHCGDANPNEKEEN